MKDSLIIDHPERQGRVRRVVQSGMTLVLWLLWFYLLLPVFEPALTLAGIDLQAMGLTITAIEIEPFAFVLLLVGTVMVSFWLWARYNLLLHRFRISSQQQHDSVAHTELAHSFGICPLALSSWQQSELLMIRHTEQGDICSVEAGASRVYPFTALQPTNETSVKSDAVVEDLLTIPRAS